MDAVELVTTTRETPGLQLSLSDIVILLVHFQAVQDAHGASDSGTDEHFWILSFEMEWAGHVHNPSHSFHRFVKGVWLEVQLALHTYPSPGAYLLDVIDNNIIKGRTLAPEKFL
jgi:hypothetical protein